MLKSSGLLCEKSEVKYEFIESHSEYPVTKWAVILGVSTSAYYDWLRTKEKRDRKRKNTQMRSNESLVKAIILMVWIVFVAPLENVVLLPPTDV